MGKQNIYNADAERYFVVEQMTIEDIALRIHVSKKTLFKWKKDGNWEAKKEQYLKSKQMFHEELYNFSRFLMNSIMNDMKEGENVDSSRLYTFTKILPQILKVKEYEDIVVHKEPTQKEFTPDLIKLVETEILGLPPRDERV